MTALSEEEDFVYVDLCPLNKRYDQKYGNDLVGFAQGRIKVEGVNELTLKLFPWCGLLMKYDLTEDLVRKWLGVHGEEPNEHFSLCNKQAMSYAKMWLEDANITNKIDFKKYSSYMYRVFNINVEPPGKTCEIIDNTSEDFLELKEN